MLRLFSSLLFTILFSCVFGADFPQCDNEPKESFVAVASNCSRAIYCNGMDSVVLDCDKESPYFSTADQKCHNSTTVCGNRPANIYNISTTTQPTIATSVATISDNSPPNADPTTIISTETTSNVTLGAELFIRNTTTSIEQSFTITLMPNEAATTVGETSTPTTPTSISTTKLTTTTQLVPVFVQCPGMDNLRKPLFLPHPKSCSQYYLCYHGVAALMKCPKKLHFDVTQQTCNTPEEARCQINFLIVREKCHRHRVSVYPHPTNCNYYYLCEYGFLMVMQCPFNMYWDYKRRVCAMRSRVRCYNATFPY